jgi:hypothetical protein
MPVGQPSVIIESHIPFGTPVPSNLVAFMDENTGRWRKCTVQEYITMILPFISQSSGYLDVDNSGDETVNVLGLGSIRLNFLNAVDEAIAIAFTADSSLFEIKLTFFTQDFASCTIDLPTNFLASDYRWDEDYNIFSPDADGIYEITCLKRGDYWNVYFSPQPITVP